MNNTQVGVATVSPQLIEHIKAAMKGYLKWEDIADTPTPAGNDGKWLQAFSDGGNSGTQWANLPVAGLAWTDALVDLTVTSEKVGILAAGEITITLPTSPTKGSTLIVTDLNSEFNDKPTIIAGNGKDIEGSPELIIDVRNAYVQLVFDGTEWILATRSHPMNITEITEESFQSGGVQYLLSRVPASKASILVLQGGNILDTGEYHLVGNTLSFTTPRADKISVRFIGLPAATNVVDTAVGSLALFPINRMGDGYLRPNGSVIQAAVYPDLVEYLTGDPYATEATLPSYDGDFLRIWGGGNNDFVPEYAIPVDLKDGIYGRWLTTLDGTTARNLWDNDTGTFTYVKHSEGYVGYVFDAPVKVTNMHMFAHDGISVAYLPDIVRLQFSDDGVTWTNASPEYNAGAAVQNTWFTLSSEETGEHRYWRINATGGFQYPESTGLDDLYWRLGAVKFDATTRSKVVGQHTDDTVGPHVHTTATVTGTAGAAAGLMIDPAGASNTITDAYNVGGETAPDHSTVVVGIKAFHYQGGSASTSEIQALREEISRLAAKVG